jgi:hypothetical protein
MATVEQRTVARCASGILHHHSPLGGYLEQEDLAFVLDVNRDYQPWLIPRAQLFAAMDTRDGDKKRGLMRFEPNEAVGTP